MIEQAAETQPSTLEQTVEIVVAYVANNTTDTAGLIDLIRTVYASLNGMGRVEEAAIEKQQPAVSIKKSITPEYLVCLEDGKKLKMLKRHLQTTYNLSPDEYRAKWRLPSDYPMVAPNYAAQRSALAKAFGLGKTPAAIPAPEPEAKGRGKKRAAPVPEPTPARRGRKPKAAA
jgi:predicted transcriptional regulator